MTLPSPFTHILSFTAALLLLAAALYSTQIIRADWAYFRADKALTIFSRQGDRREAVYLTTANTNANRALSLWPDNPDYLVLAARIRAWQAFQSGQPALIASSYSEALDLLRQAIQLRPADARTWAMLAEYKATAHERDQEMRHAREKALELGGADQRLVKKMLRL